MRLDITLTGFSEYRASSVLGNTLGTITFDTNGNITSLKNMSLPVEKFLSFYDLVVIYSKLEYVIKV